MKEFSKHELTFLKPIAIEDSYKLYSDFNVISEMMIKNSSAEVTIDDDKWTFQKKGLLTTFIHINKEDLKVNLYKFPVRNFYQTKFNFKGGIKVKFNLYKFCNTSWAWFDDKKEIIAEYKIPGNKIEKGINILNEKYLNLNNLTLLIMLGWYLLLTTYNDAYGFTLK